LRLAVLFAGLGLTIAGAGLAWANTPVKATMRDWKVDLAGLERMVVFNQGFDPVEMAALAARVSNDAGKLSARIAGGNAKAQDIKSRFQTLAADADALAAATKRDAARPKYEQLRSACVSCHDAYAQ